MVKVFFGIDNNAILDVDTTFDGVYLPEWFDDPIVKQMVQDIDKSVVLSQHCIQSPVLGQIPPQYLSGGVKTCIMLLKAEEEILIDLIACGENCEKWLSYIFSQRDVRVTMSGYDLMFKGLDIHGICENDGSLFSGSKEWSRLLLKWVGEGSER